jgi:bacteriophage N4 adsorption protein A
MLGEISMERGKPARAAGYFQRSVADGAGVAALRGLALATYASGDRTAAAQAWERLLQRPDPSVAQRAEALTNLGYIYTEQGKATEAQRAFTSALALPGERAPLERSLGIVLSTQSRWADALVHFERALAAHPDAINALYVGRSHAALKHTDAAIKYFEQALSRSTELTAIDQRSANAELSALYHLNGQPERTILYAKRALDLTYEPAVALRLGQAQRLVGKIPEARATLENMSSQGLSAAQEAERQDELGRLYATEHNFAGAAKAQQRALQAGYSPVREYQLGVYQRDEGNYPAAIQHWENAVKADPNNAFYARNLGYAYATAGREREMTRVFEALERTDLVDPKVPTELGYLYLRNGQTGRAVTEFRTALDRHESLAATATDQAERASDQFRLRQEVGRLSNYFDFTVYESFRSGQGQVGTAASSLAGGIIPSQGGVELSLQPPGFGLINGRIFQVFTRLLWSNDPDSLSIDGRSVQGGVGVRYKPLQHHNLFVSAEKLYRVGENALNSWLLRAAYGWSNGVDLTFDRATHNYTYLYGDLGYVTGRGDFLAFYGEAREGLSFQPWDRVLISPHVVMDGRVQTADVGHISYLEGGAGVGIKLYFNEGHYEGYRSNVELLVQYKVGIVNVQDSVVVTGVVRF